MSRTLRYYTICKLTIWSITVSWMLAEGTKLLDQKQRTVFAHSNNSSWSISICASFQSVNLRKVTGRGPDDSCTCNGLHYLRGTPYLGNQIVSLFALCPVGASSLLYWTVNKPDFCSGERYYLYPLRLFAIQIFFEKKKKNSKEQRRVSTSMHKGSRSMSDP